MTDIVSLTDFKIQKIKDSIDEHVVKSNNEVSWITDEVLEESVDSGDTKLKNVVKTVWYLAGRLDEIEVELLKLKLLIRDVLINKNEKE